MQWCKNKPIESDSEAIKTLPHTYATAQSAINACKRNFEKLQRGVATFSLTSCRGQCGAYPRITGSGFRL